MMINEKNKIDPFIEWIVWGSLESKQDLELILLKGHLLLEKIVEITLGRYGVKKIEDFSFYRKVIELNNIIPNKQGNKDIIVESLIRLNRLRNKLAHEIAYKIEDDNEFLEWSTNILANLKGRKWCNYTHRTKILHSFSVLTINILDL